MKMKCEAAFILLRYVLNDHLLHDQIEESILSYINYIQEIQQVMMPHFLLLLLQSNCLITLLDLVVKIRLLRFANQQQLIEILHLEYTIENFLLFRKQKTFLKLLEPLFLYLVGPLMNFIQLAPYLRSQIMTNFQEGQLPHHLFPQ